MKFKNVKTGTTYYSIEIAKKNFCNSITRCMDCELSSKNNKKGVRCEEFCNSEPEMAAKIMGIEIIDEGDDKMEPKKSYLAEILGLEEDEVFGVEWNKFIYRIHEGRRQTQSNVGMWFDCSCENDLAYLIENKDKIIKIKCLTEQEKKICDDCSAKWVSRDMTGKTVTLWESKPELEHNTYINKTFGAIGSLSIGLFPSVKPGDCIEVR